MTNLRTLLTETADRVADYRESLAERRVAPEADPERLREGLGGPLSAQGIDRQVCSTSWSPPSNPR